MKTIREYPSQKLLREYFDYREDGFLIWKKKTSKKVNELIGSVAGSIGTKGYKHVGFRGQKYLLHRLIWIWHNGDIPEGMLVDHMEGVESNRIGNLQLLNNRKNCIKSKLKSNNTSGYRGVVQRENGKFRARITLFGDRINLGTFDTAEEAAIEYDRAALKYFGNFAVLNFFNELTTKKNDEPYEHQHIVDSFNNKPFDILKHRPFNIEEVRSHFTQ